MAEVLIALALLGVVAAFAIPKVLQNQGETKRIAVFKETIATISEINHAGWLSGELTPATEISYFTKRLNPLQVCTNSFTQGCWPQAFDYPGWGASYGFLLPNGASLVDFQNNNSTCEGIAMDWNGAAGPNVEGEDQLRLNINFGTTPCAASQNSIKAGAIGPVNNAASIALWQSIFN